MEFRKWKHIHFLACLHFIVKWSVNNSTHYFYIGACYAYIKIWCTILGYLRKGILMWRATFSFMLLQCWSKHVMFRLYIKIPQAAVTHELVIIHDPLLPCEITVYERKSYLRKVLLTGKNSLIRERVRTANWTLYTQLQHTMQYSNMYALCVAWYLTVAWYCPCKRTGIVWKLLKASLYRGMCSKHPQWKSKYLLFNCVTGRRCVIGESYS